MRPQDKLLRATASYVLLVAVVRTSEPQRRPPLPSGPYLVLGLARAGLAAVQVLGDRFGAGSVRAWDDADAARRNLPSGVRIAAGNDINAIFDGVRTVVKSPGVPLEHPLIADARRRGLPVIDELELGWRLTPHPTVAVTGTNGKSTTTSLVAAALRADGHATALTGNVEAVQGGKPLCQIPPEYSGWVVAEVSSYQAVGLELMLPDAAVFTNLTPDHLLWHGSMEAYGQAKRRVFIDGSRSVELAVINIDDPFGKKLAEDVQALGGQVLTYGWDIQANYRLQACDWLYETSQISLNTPTGALQLRTALPGAHNAANLTAALAAADGLGLKRERVLPAIASASAPPGRLERVDCDQRFDVFVDFAHSEDGLACALAALRGIARPRGGRLIAVVALPQGTRSTRRACGRAARNGCEHLILTAYSARGEPPLRALAWTLEGAREVQGATFEIALQRRAAIARALSLAQPGDVVAILGRGPLRTLACDRHGGNVPFDDCQVTRELLNPDGHERAGRPAASAVVA